MCIRDREEGDLIELDIPARILRIAGIAGEKKSEEEVQAVLALSLIHISRNTIRSSLMTSGLTMIRTSRPA